MRYSIITGNIKYQSLFLLSIRSVLFRLFYPNRAKIYMYYSPNNSVLDRAREQWQLPPSYPKENSKYEFYNVNILVI
jgi:hypothetical protein